MKWDTHNPPTTINLQAPPGGSAVTKPQPPAGTATSANRRGLAHSRLVQKRFPRHARTCRETLSSCAADPLRLKGRQEGRESQSRNRMLTAAPQFLATNGMASLLLNLFLGRLCASPCQRHLFGALLARFANDWGGRGKHSAVPTPNVPSIGGRCRPVRGSDGGMIGGIGGFDRGVLRPLQWQFERERGAFAHPVAMHGQRAT